MSIMELKNVMTSCMLIMVGLIIGIFINYKVMLFESIHVQVPVMNSTERLRFHVMLYFNFGGCFRLKYS